MSNKISPEQFYDNLASKYDETLKSPDCNAQYVHEARKVFAKYYGTTATGSIIDIGCGTGFLSELLEGNFQYAGIDISGKMLEIAAERGYQVIHQPIEKALANIESKSYDFVFCLGSLLFVEDIETALKEIYRIAQKAVFISLDETTEEYIKNCACTAYNHSQIPFPNAREDYWILGWKSPTLGISIRTRMIYEPLLT